jgi:hypothetical protein
MCTGVFFFGGGAKQKCSYSNPRVEVDIGPRCKDQPLGHDDGLARIFSHLE